eukprot:COSAG01_NODE_4609_length_4882_cov_2.470834_2_plen_114_part_00
MRWVCDLSSSCVCAMARQDVMVLIILMVTCHIGTSAAFYSDDALRCDKRTQLVLALQPYSLARLPLRIDSFRFAVTEVSSSLSRLVLSCSFTVRLCVVSINAQDGCNVWLFPS